MPYIHAESDPRHPADVLYHSDDGNKMIRHGGTWTSRNNNPGNIQKSDFAQRNGAIGHAGGFAVFPDLLAGHGALIVLVHDQAYISLSIKRAIEKYAPSKDNDTVNYLNMLKQMAGLDIQRRLSELTSSEFDKVVAAIERIEGFVLGVERPVRKIIGTLTDGKRLTHFLIEGKSNYISLAEAISLAGQGEIDAVIVRKANGTEYLRASPDGFADNNFSAMAKKQS